MMTTMRGPLMTSPFISIWAVWKQVPKKAWSRPMSAILNIRFPTNPLIFTSLSLTILKAMYGKVSYKWLPLMTSHSSSSTLWRPPHPRQCLVQIPWLRGTWTNFWASAISNIRSPTNSLIFTSLSSHLFSIAPPVHHFMHLNSVHFLWFSQTFICSLCPCSPEAIMLEV